MQKRGQYGLHSRRKTFFFKITNTDHKLSKPFCFIILYITNFTLNLDSNYQVYCISLSFFLIFVTFNCTICWLFLLYTLPSLFSFQKSCICSHISNANFFLPFLDYLQSLPNLKILIFHPCLVYLKDVSATFLLVCFIFLKESNCETRKNVFISPQKLFSFLR